VRLVEDKLKQQKSLYQAVRKAFIELEGRNTIIILFGNKKEIIAARNGSPLVIGINDKTNEIFFSSDTLSFAPYANKMIVIENGQIVHFLDGTISLFEITTGKELSYKIENIDIENDKVDKEGFDHFMLKEIYEQPATIRQVSKQSKNELLRLTHAIKAARQVYTIGSGTTGIAAAQMAYYLRKYGNVNAISLIGADAQEFFDFFTKDDLVIAPSQSGETADVLEVLEILKKKGTKIATYVNMAGSTMTRMADYKFMAQAGPEICVMSTKVFVSQISWGYLLAKTVQGEYEQGKASLEVLAKAMEEYLGNKEVIAGIKKLAEELKAIDDIFLIGKGQNFQIIREGMVKLIEGTYKHAHAIPAGDLKHYAITLMEKGVPVIVAVSGDDSLQDTLNAASEVKARGARVIGIADASHQSFDSFLSVADTGETGAILHVVPLQLLSYFTTILLGNNVDKPRNIAKSVTVK
jgi:glucosamine--fructose-6-phosphate aminotransferase (isomerizing)